MPDAEVNIAESKASAATRFSGITNPQGVAEFTDVACGAWSLTASKTGYHTLKDTPLRMNGAGNSEVDITLTPSVVHESIEVHESNPLQMEHAASPSQELQTDDIKNLPLRPTTVTAALPLVPGVFEDADGEIKIDGTGEHRSAFVVNQTDVTDPATGKFGQTVPIDGVQVAEVLNTPFLAEYGRFTAGVVSVETRRGGETWHAELNDPFPEFRFRSWHMRGLRDATPRGLLSGPLMKGKLYFMSANQYSIHKVPDQTLPFPFNESKQEFVNSLTQLDYIVSPKQILTATLHVSPQHTNFVNPQFFSPQEVTPSYRQHNYVAMIADRLAIGGGTLDSTVSLQRFDATVGSQGTADMILTPVGNRGNYFADQDREAGRLQSIETWSPAQKHFAGTHFFKFGSSLTRLDNSGQFEARPVDIQNNAGLLLRRIEFSGGSPYKIADMEGALFAQDQWALNSHVSLDLGGRVEYQDITGTVRMAPRLGVSWMPVSNGRTVVRGGYGIFYDRVPLSIYTFRSMPQRTVIDYAPDGSIIGAPYASPNLIGPGSVSRSPLFVNKNRPGNFVPQSDTWNISLEQRVASFIKLRTLYSSSHSVGLITVDPAAVDASSLTLLGGGRSQYKQFEVSARLDGRHGQQLFVAYTRSRADGNLNEFSNYLGNFPAPLIRRSVYSHLPGDLPNRFLAWGNMALPGGLQILPMVEYHTGLPYSSYDQLGDYVGVPNLNRFPSYVNADARILKDLKVNPKYTVRVSVSGFNLTNHFNALNLHTNIADPQYGTFFGNYHFRYRADFDILF